MNLEKTLEALRNSQVEFVLIGGAAMAVQGSAYVTRLALEGRGTPYEIRHHAKQKVAGVMKAIRFVPSMRTGNEQ
jgi:hypothetical protein